MRGVLQIAEAGSWVAVSCHEAMVDTALATRALSLCEIVVRLARNLPKMPNVVGAMLCAWGRFVSIITNFACIMVV